MEGECLALDESQTREAVRQGFECKLCLQFAQRGAQAISSLRKTPIFAARKGLTLPTSLG
jgi:hypothetical protein